MITNLLYYFTALILYLRSYYTTYDHLLTSFTMYDHLFIYFTTYDHLLYLTSHDHSLTYLLTYLLTLLLMITHLLHYLSTHYHHLPTSLHFTSVNYFTTYDPLLTYLLTSLLKCWRSTTHFTTYDHLFTYFITYDWVCSLLQTQFKLNLRPIFIFFYRLPIPANITIKSPLANSTPTPLSNNSDSASFNSDAIHPYLEKRINAMEEKLIHLVKMNRIMLRTSMVSPPRKDPTDYTPNLHSISKAIIGLHESVSRLENHFQLTPNSITKSHHRSSKNDSGSHISDNPILSTRAKNNQKWTQSLQFPLYQFLLIFVTGL